MYLYYASPAGFRGLTSDLLLYSVAILVVDLYDGLEHNHSCVVHVVVLSNELPLLRNDEAEIAAIKSEFSECMYIHVGSLQTYLADSACGFHGELNALYLATVAPENTSQTTNNS